MLFSKFRVFYAIFLTIFVNPICIVGINLKAPFGTRKVEGKEKKNVKENYILMFGSKMKNIKEINIIKSS